MKHKSKHGKWADVPVEIFTKLRDVIERDLVDVQPRDSGMVVRMRGPYASSKARREFFVDYWPTTRTCALMVPGKSQEVWRKVTPDFAERVALTGQP